MVIVQSYEPSPWNESAPGAPWGGQSTIWDACRDLMLAEKGRYDQPLHLKTRRMHFELPQNSDRPGIRDPPRSATLRRMPQWPAPTFDSSAYKNLQKLGPEPIPPLPTAYGRLDGDETWLPKASGPPSSREGREGREEEKSDLPLELKWPGVHRVAWGDKPEVGSQANSSSPRYAPFRYGAAIVRQQRGIHGMAGNGPPSSRGSSRLQRSASQQASQQSQSHSQQTQQTQQQSQNSHPSHPSRSLSHPSGKNSRSISGSGPKGSDSRSRDVDVPPIELIPPYYMTQNTKNTQRGESKNSARMQQKAFEHIAALSNV